MKVCTFQYLLGLQTLFSLSSFIAGRGVVRKKKFSKGDFLLQYDGEFIPEENIAKKKTLLGFVISCYERASATGE